MKEPIILFMGKGVFKSIDPHDINITPFKAYKSWAFETVNDLELVNIDRFQAIKPNKTVFSGGTVTLDSAETLYDSSSLYYNAADNRAAAVHWYSLSNLYFKQENKRYDSFGISDETNIRYLYDNAAVISLPQKRIGERIKPSSVVIRYNAPSLYQSDVELIDDGKGNLIDTSLDSPVSNQILYLGFNSMTYADNYRSNTNEYHALNSRNGAIDPVVFTSFIPNLSVTSKNVWIAPKSLPSGSEDLLWGNSALFHRDGYIRIQSVDELNFKASDDYAISFWLQLRPDLEDFYYILTKRSTKKSLTFVSNGTYSVNDSTNLNSQYPFEILYNEDSIECSISTGPAKSTITAAIDFNDKHHVVLQKTGSNFELYIDGNLEDSAPIPSGNIHNDSDIFIGSLGTTVKSGTSYIGAQASIDEFFIFSKSLIQEEISQLSNVSDLNLMTTNTNVVGNVIYDHGIVVISDPRPKYGTSTLRLFNDVLYHSETSNALPSILDSFHFEYKSTVGLYEHEYLIRLRGDEFNFTSNPTIRIDDDMNSEFPKTFVADPEFGPYITTIGMYNDKGQLLAIGKLGTPIKKRDDVDLTFVVKFDS